MTGRIERKNAAAPAPRTSAVQKAGARAEQAAAQVANLFVAAAQSAGERLSPGGKPLHLSASPSALWEGGQNLAGELVRMAPGNRSRRAEQAKEERGEVATQINDRVGHLEKKWKRVGAKKKEAALRDFVKMSEVAPKDKAKIEAIVEKSSKLEAKIQELAGELKQTYPARTPAEDKTRRAIKVELVELRQQQRALVNEAKTVIDASGHGAALLAVGEAALDPDAAKKGESLISMMGRWLHLTSVVDFFVEFFKADQQKDADVRKKAEIIDVHHKSIINNGFSKADLGMIAQGLKTSSAA